MQGKILIVDAIATNRIVLKIKLSSAYYTVLQATSVAEALKIASQEQPNLVITAFDLPDADAGALCAGLSKQEQTARIPILAIGESDDLNARKMMLSNGAQDVLVKPVPDPLLLSRVRSLIREHHSDDEWHMRDAASRTFGMAEQHGSFAGPGHIQVVSDDRGMNHIWATQLRLALRDKVTNSTLRDALQCLKGDVLPDVFVLVLTDDQKAAMEQLHLISSIRANAGTRHSGILVLQTVPNAEVGANALDLGADDLMLNGFDLEELGLRLASILNRKRKAERLRHCVNKGLRAAIYDPLTGLYNRRYAFSELARLIESAGRSGPHFAVMLADMDHFKRINDAFGHAAGDSVLVETAQRLRSQLRPIDMAARIGGEEFLLVVPGTTALEATQVAERLCKTFRDTPFVIPASNTALTITISIGVCMSDSLALPLPAQDDKAAQLIDQADQALYAAKSRGRNCVRLVRPAA